MRASRYRALGHHGPYPDWCRALRGKSGSYRIRDAETKEDLYTGESHTGRLYQTLTRHFQAWSGPTAGATFARANVEVAVVISAPSEAVKAQNKHVCRNRPKFNVQTSCPTGEVQPGTEFDPAKFAA